MSKKSYFRKRYNKLAVLYANAIIVNQDCIKEKISYQNGYKELEKQIESYKRDLIEQESRVTNLIGVIAKLKYELNMLKLAKPCRVEKDEDGISVYVLELEGEPCADSNTD